MESDHLESGNINIYMSRVLAAQIFIQYNPISVGRRHEYESNRNFSCSYCFVFLDINALI